ncbi:MAG: hypothetical protein JW741_03270 [Sedimentisphaerales bacterium]|nr:hypothetical protein [Sedimentisphaerales bacterium]
MNAADVFGVIVRTIGLLILLGALWQIALGLLALLGGGPYNTIALLLSGIPALLLGLWFLKGAKFLMAYAYPKEETNE